MPAPEPEPSEPEAPTRRPAPAPAREPAPESPTLSPLPLAGPLGTGASPAAPSSSGGAAEVRLSGRAGNRYAVEEELGKGGMGVVHRVLDRDLGRHVAYKALLPGLEGERDLVLRFVEEARATAGLEHPAIVPVHDIGLDEQDRVYFTMKLVRGRTLAAVVEDARRGEAATAREFTRFRLLEVVVEVARAVAFAHERGIVHRDLKPHNIMIGGHGEVHVMDWGLSKALARAPEPRAREGSPPSRDEPRRARTLFGAVVGTPAYMSPEQAEGDPSKIGPLADVYALGATLYHVLTGRPPFEAPSSPEVLAKLAECDPPRPRALDRAVPPALEAICLRAMNRHRQLRYPSARALADDLQAFLEDRPVRAFPEGPLLRARRWARRHRRAIGAATLLLLALALGVAGAAQARRAAVAREREALLVLARGRAAEAMARLSRERARLPSEEAIPARALEPLLGLALEALSAADQRLALDPESQGGREGAFAAALALGELARAGEQWGLAESALDRAGGLGVDPGRAEAARAALASARTRVQDEHRRDVEEAIALVRSGAPLARPGGTEDALFRLVAHREPQTVALLAAALDGTTATLEASARATLLSAATPTAEEAQAGLPPVAGLEEALERARALRPGAALDPGSEEAIARAGRRLEEREARRREGAARVAPLSADGVVTAAQARALGPGGRLLARLSCEALGRIGIAEGALPSLARHLAALREERMAIPAGAALARLAPDSAPALLGAARRRFGPAGPFWRQVGPLLEPEGEAALEIEARPPAATASPEGASATADVEALTRALEKAPRDASRWLARAEARLLRKEPDAAAADLTRALEIDPWLAPAWARRGEARRRRGDLEGALQDLSRAIELAPRSGRFLTLRAEARVAAGDLEGAVADYGAALSLDPRDASALTWRGNTRRKLGDQEGAIADETAAIALDPASSVAWDARGSSKRLLGDAAGALADHTQAIALDPKRAWGFANRGLVRLETGDLAGAIQDESEAISLEPTLAAAWERRGRALARTRDLAGAAEDLSRAVALSPSYAEAWIQLALLRRSEGALDQALEHLSRAIEEKPLSATAWRLRGEVHLDRGEREEAARDLGRALELAPGDASARAALERAR